MFGHSLDKYINSTMHQTSNALGWSNILAERWTHAPGELPRLVPRETEVAIQLSGQALVDRAGGGRREHTHGHRGTIWLCPAGIEEEYINVVEPLPDCLHLFLPGQPFAEMVQREFDIDPARAGLRYQAVDHDPFVTMIADQIVSELSNETGVGRLFVESLSVALSAHLLKNYSELGLARPMADRALKPLESRRLSRVVDFIDANLDQDFTVAELAGIACMSVGHFTRSFRAATGRAPYAFVAERRLMLAKRRLRDERCSIEEIAFSAGFSSLANFSKAFRHSTGLSPSQFRARTGV